MSNVQIVLILISIALGIYTILLLRKNFIAVLSATERLQEIQNRLFTTLHLENSFGLTQKTTHTILCELRAELQEEQEKVSQLYIYGSDLDVQMDRLEGEINRYLQQFEDSIYFDNFNSSHRRRRLHSSF